MPRSSVVAAVCVAILAAGTSAVVADDGWNPFKAKDEARRGRESKSSPEIEVRQPLPPMNGVELAPWSSAPTSAGSAEPTLRTIPRQDEPASWSQGPGKFERSAPPSQPAMESVQRTELQPVIANSDLPFSSDLWSGLEPSQLQEQISSLSIPPRSGALAELWRQLWTSEEVPSLGQRSRSFGKPVSPALAGLRIEALYRAGLAGEVAKIAKQQSSQDQDPIAGLLLARASILLRTSEEACTALKGQKLSHNDLPKPLRHEYLLLAALCGAAARDPGTAGLAADLLRAEVIEAPIPLAALDSIAAGAIGSMKLPPSRPISLLDYRFLELAGSERLPGLSASAEPALQVVLALSASDLATRILAGEAALALHAVTPAELAGIYRSLPGSPFATDGALAERAEPPLKRAALFKAFEAERTPMRKARLARALMDETRRARGPYQQVAAMLAPALEAMLPAPETGWFAETAVEVMLAAGRYGNVRRWADAALGDRHGNLRHWLVLADIGDPAWQGHRGDDLAVVEQLAVRGRLPPDLMHRLVTVLDALDYQIPIPLWEAASRSPQPSSGYLPATGVLSQLQEASRQKAFARVVLTAIQALGPDSGETANLLALGDTIRGLKRAGLESSARRLGLEALYASWPRSAHN